MITKTGFSQMNNLYPSYKHHHIPLWLKKKIRLSAIKKGTWIKGYDAHSFFINDRDYRGLWDHWASVLMHDLCGDKNPIRAEVLCSNDRSVITQPYGNNDLLAERFAFDHSCFLKVISPGTWQPNTRLYIFSVKAI